MYSLPLIDGGTIYIHSFYKQNNDFASEIKQISDYLQCLIVRQYQASSSVLSANQSKRVTISLLLGLNVAPRPTLVVALAGLVHGYLCDPRPRCRVHGARADRHQERMEDRHHDGL
jgi:hypothetical protein